jgi:hypothetical protein
MTLLVFYIEIDKKKVLMQLIVNRYRLFRS